MKTHSILFVFFLLCTSLFSNAQSIYGERLTSVINTYGIPTENVSWFSYSPDLFDEQIEIYTKVVSPQKLRWTFIFNIENVELDNFSLDLNYNLELFDIYDDGNSFNLIFFYGPGKLKLVSINKKNGSTATMDYALPSKISNLSKSSIAVAGQYLALILAGNKSVVTINLNTHEVNTTPLFENTKTRKNLLIEDIIIADNEESFLWITDKKKVNAVQVIENNTYQTCLVNLSTKHVARQVFYFSSKKKYNLYNFGVVKKDDSYIVSGLYQSKRQITKKNISWISLSLLMAASGNILPPPDITAEGLFIAQFNEGEFKHFKKYNFYAFESYKASLPEAKKEFLNRVQAKQKDIISSQEVELKGFFKLEDGYLIILKLCAEAGCERPITVVARFNINDDLVWDNSISGNAFSWASKVEVYELSNGNIEIDYHSRKLLGEKETYVINADGEFLNLSNESRKVKPPIVAVERKFQEKGGKIGMPLTLLTTHQNFDGVKLLDKYHTGFKGEFHLISKPISPTLKFKWHAGGFIYGDAISLLFALAGRFANFENSYLGMGAHSGISFLLKERLEVGAEMPLGFELSSNGFNAITGATPFISYIPNNALDGRLYIKLETPLWKNSANNPPFGLFISAGLHFQNYRKAK